MIISVDNIEFQCQGAVQRPKHARVGAHKGVKWLVRESLLDQKCFRVMIFWCYFVSRTRARGIYIETHSDTHLEH